MSTLESVAPTNIRRSTKVYSYEEEKWDIEMKQEAERRQKQQLLQTSDVLQLLRSGNVSKKLQELIEAELIKEKDIRSNMLKVSHYVAWVCMNECVHYVRVLLCAAIAVYCSKGMIS